jgi:Bacterial dnaA protein helix-turn-helix/Helix-turn-helix
VQHLPPDLPVCGPGASWGPALPPWLPWRGADTNPTDSREITLLVSIEPIFLRPGPERVLAVVAELTRVPVITVLGPARTHPVSHARKLAMYLLRTEAGLSHAEVGRLVGRGTATVMTLTRDVAEDVHGVARAELACARAILRERRAAAEVPTRRVSPRSLGGYLVGLTAAREAAGLTKKELAQRAGLTRETVSRIETLNDRPNPRRSERWQLRSRSSRSSW